MPLECLLAKVWVENLCQAAVHLQTASPAWSLAQGLSIGVEWNRLSSGLAHAAEESYAFRNAHEGVFHVLLVLQADGPRIVILAE